jgi:hypothetical protein
LDGLHFGNVDVEDADGVAFEFLLGRLVAFRIWQAPDPVTLQVAIQRRARQVRDRRLEA